MITLRRTAILACAAGALVAGTARDGLAQPAARVLTVEELRAPSSAAVTLLGTAPTSIERPDSPRALVVNLLSTVADAGGVPKNYSAQVAPYWMKSHDSLLFDSYMHPSVGQSLIRSLGISFATADWITGTGKTATDLGSRLAFGVSTVALPGRIDPKLDALRDSLLQMDQDMIELLRRRRTDPALKVLEDRRAEITKAIATEAVKPAPNEDLLLDLGRQLERTNQLIATIGPALDRPIAALEQAIRSTTLQIQSLNVHRSGAQLSIAAAWSFQIPDDVFGDARASRAAIWVTPSYRARVRKSAAAPGSDPDEESEDDGDTRPRFLDLLGVARYVRNSVATTSATDLGGRVVWGATDVVSVSAEVVRRWWSSASAVASSYRAVGMVEARLGDKAYLFASFGRGFTDAETESTLVSVVGLNLGFGDKPQLAIR
jgi:hypothetical protein